MTDSSKKRLKAQPEGMIFALDIGTRSIIGIVGTVEGEKLRVIAMEKVEHTQRSMIDGQIEDIEQVAKVARIVKSRLETTLRCKLNRVCVAAAGRALRTQRASFEMEFPQPQRLDDEIISRLEAGAIGEAEAAFTNGLDIDSRQFYLVGHTTVQYYMDNYPISSLLDHQARRIQADVIATFLPSEVVDSLYSAMNRTELEVASLTLEPIAAINAVIPKNLRLLNLALVDIGAGTSDIAICRDGGVVGYTMVTVAGDEITEALMKKYLLDFNTAESVKTQLGTQNSVRVTDILGIEQTITQDDMMNCIEDATANLCREISEHICAVNGAPASAVFLAGGGSKLASIRDGIAKHMNMDVNRVAIAGNNFQTYAVSDLYDLNDPEYATPLGIAISAGLNLITESFHVNLNGNRARLFRNSTMTVLDILMMNGFSYQDLLPRTGQKLVIEVNGKQVVYYGDPGEPAVLRLNGQDAKISDLVHSGDSIEFTPAVHGQSAQRSLMDLLADNSDQAATVNGKTVVPVTPLKNGDMVIMESSMSVAVTNKASSVKKTTFKNTKQPSSSKKAPATEPAPTVKHSVELSPPSEESVSSAQPPSPPISDVSSPPSNSIEFILNNKPIALSKKSDGSPYYLMDMLELSGIDLEHPTGDIVLRVNGADSSFLQDLKSGDRLEIFFAPGHTRE
jgi:cell division protein FtsA